MMESESEKDTVYDAFISYSSKDKIVTDALCHYLEEQKIRCWIAPRDIRPGQKYAQAIDQAIKMVKIFILVCSDDSLRSQWVQMETNLAVSDEKIIIPFKIKNCSLEGTGMKLYLNDRHWIDAFPKPEEAFGDLAAAVIAFLEARESDPVERTTVFPRQPDPATQYEFDGTPFSKEQILKIANFQVWLSFFFLPAQILVLAMLPLCVYLSTIVEPGFPALRPVLPIVAIICLFISILIPFIFLVTSRLLQKKHLVVTILLALLVTTISVICVSALHDVFSDSTPSSMETSFPSASDSYGKTPPPDEDPPVGDESAMGIFVFFLFFFCPAILLYEAKKLKKILHAAGLKTTFWGVPKSEIKKFAEESSFRTPPV